MKRQLLTITILAALAGAASAETLAARERVLAAQIVAARRARPASFRALADLKATIPELDRRKRGRLAPVMPRLRALGPAALLPMLEELGATGRGEPLAGSALVAWRVGLLEAVGALADPRAVPVLVRALERESEPAVVRAAAGALGSIGSDEAASLLSARATRAGGARQLALVAGMGQCRRLAAARALAGMLARRPGDELAAALAKALGELGTAWAWQTPRLAALGEAAAVRALAATALVDAFVRTPAAREAATTALLLVDDPGTPAAIARARRGAPAALESALAGLARRIEQSPFRRHAR
jgi:hypothetical protein